MQKRRLDIALTSRGLVSSRSQAESYIKLGVVYVDKKPITKPGFFVSANAVVELRQAEQYVSRAGLKLASVAQKMVINFADKTVLDVGSSTGGFTDYALKNGAKRVFAVDVGTHQMHPSLRNNSKIILHEQTNILDVVSSVKHLAICKSASVSLNSRLDIIIIDVSFVSLRKLLPHIVIFLADQNTDIVAMVKPQFEAGDEFKHDGVIKNDAVRRKILQQFELWAKRYFVVLQKADSDVRGTKGNQERFFVLRKKT